MGVLIGFAGVYGEENLERLRRPDLGPFNFEVVIDPLRIVRSLLSEADELGGWLPREKLKSILDAQSELELQISKINNFNPSDPDPSRVRINICDRIEYLKDRMLEYVAPYIRMNEQTLSNIKRDLENRVLKTENIALEWDAIKSEWDKRLQDERLASSVQATNEAFTFFDARAKTHARSARRFGVAAIIDAGLVAAWIISTRKQPLGISWKSGHIAESIIDGLPHFTLLTLATFFIGLFLRNYRINQHLAVLNLTKSATLRAGESFVKSVHDDATRDIVLETVVRSAFALGETGYLQGDQERPILEAPNLSSLMHVISGQGATK